MARHDSARPWWLLPPGHIHFLWWIPIALLVLWVDYDSDLYNQFPVVYVIPVALAAWYSGRWPALALAVAIPLGHAALLTTLHRPSGSVATLLAMTAFRGVVIGVLALWFVRLAAHERDLRRQVQQLEGLLPICAYCKNIRNAEGSWERLETFISKRSDAEFSHAFCPACLTKHHPELLETAPSPSTSPATGR